MSRSTDGSYWLDNFSTFIAAIRDIEHAVDKLYDANNFGTARSSFATKLYASQSNLKLTRPEVELLRHAHNVRNAWVHDNSGITVSAEFLHSVQAIAKRLRPKQSAFDLLKRAKAGGTHAGILAAQPTDQLRTVLIHMAAGDFSQVPAYDGDKLLGMLTAERLLMYIADSLRSDPNPIVLLDVSIKVSDVTGAIMPCPHFPVVAPPSVILEAFKESEIGGNPLSAVIITQTGERNEKPLAIVTASDLPLLA